MLGVVKYILILYGGNYIVQTLVRNKYSGSAHTNVDDIVVCLTLVILLECN